MNYIEIVNDAIQYIESNLHRKLALEELASRYYISTTYFYRIFHAVTNQTVKSYILGRRLTAAAIELRKTDRNIADIAFQHGFNSHEQFTRDFKKMFHITPYNYRKNNISVALKEELDVVERDFRNKNKDIIIDYSCRELKEITLLGKEIFFQPEIRCELEEAIRRGNNFEEEYFIKGTAGRLFNVMRACNSNGFRINCFSGIPAGEYTGDCSGLKQRTIPASKYAVFRYPDILGLFFHTVLGDLHKWLRVSKFKLNKGVGFDLFTLQTEDYEQTRKFYLYLPVL
ncbi:AraC family transcriptional regulator [Desulfotomaculum arcticum]|uniref:AraC family transcriptional regulator n=1 Tax=Desulfotruncus arcticus DSM 17038 TaxID=1121424 RepID=A0A1I2X5Q9_9FIRM|nr:AraC family transcriptional regulator [Desulfotruncus arcticus]SFH08874.1 AraC family transcriptional regulator [Desulfotomaculum arcticum] [Desulfotruncus arcticus DSM 17038]